MEVNFFKWELIPAEWKLILRMGVKFLAEIGSNIPSE